LPIADCRLPIADCRLPIADCRLPIADCRLPIADCRLPEVSNVKPQVCDSALAVTFKAINWLTWRIPFFPFIRISIGYGFIYKLSDYFKKCQGPYKVLRHPVLLLRYRQISPENPDKSPFCLDFRPPLISASALKLPSPPPNSPPKDKKPSSTLPKAY
jgi:hypothetical protein